MTDLCLKFTKKENINKMLDKVALSQQFWKISQRNDYCNILEKIILRLFCFRVFVQLLWNFAFVYLALHCIAFCIYLGSLDSVRPLLFSFYSTMNDGFDIKT